MKGRICSVVNFKFPQLPGTNSSAHFVTVAVEDHTMIQCCGSGIIFSGSSYEFLEFWIRIQTILIKHIWKLLKTHLKFTQKEKSTIYLPYSISYHSSIVHTVQNSQA